MERDYSKPDYKFLMGNIIRSSVLDVYHYVHIYIEEKDYYSFVEETPRYIIQVNWLSGQNVMRVFFNPLFSDTTDLYHRLYDLLEVVCGGAGGRYIREGENPILFVGDPDAT